MEIEPTKVNLRKNNGYFNPHSLGLKNLKCQQRTLNPGINKARVNSEGEDPQSRDTSTYNNVEEYPSIDHVASCGKGPHLG